MKTLFLAIVFAISVAAQEHTTAAQEHPQAGAEAHGTATAGAHESGDPLLMYKWINFGILFAGLAYLAVKTGGPFFRARSQAILDDLNIAVRRSEEAAAEAAKIERRMETLPAEIEKLRATAKAQFQMEADRIQSETTEQLAKVEASTQQEIVSAAKEASNQLKAFSAELALNLAESKIRDRITPAEDAALVSRFVEGLPVGGRKS